MNKQPFRRKVFMVVVTIIVTALSIPLIPIVFTVRIIAASWEVATYWAKVIVGDE